MKAEESLQVFTHFLHNSSPTMTIAGVGITHHISITDQKSNKIAMHEHLLVKNSNVRFSRAKELVWTHLLNSLKNVGLAGFVMAWKQYQRASRKSDPVILELHDCADISLLVLRIFGCSLQSWKQRSTLGAPIYVHRNSNIVSRGVVTTEWALIWSAC